MGYEGAELSVSNIVISELRIKVIDCRSNSFIPNARVNKIIISGNNKTITKEFDLKKDKDKIKTTGAEGSIEALQKLRYGEKDTKKKSYDSTWLKHYNDYWKDRVPDFTELEETETPPDTMMEYILEEYNSHHSTDGNGLLRVQIPNPMMENSNVKIEIKFFDFPIVLESSSTVCRSNENNNGGTNFLVEWNGNQSMDWNKGFGWDIVYNNRRSELKVSEEIDVNFDTTTQSFDTSSLSTYYNSEDDNSGHFVFLAMEWCQPIWDGIDDPNPDNHNSTRSNDYALVNMKHGNQWVRGLNMHIPSKHTSGSGPYYGIFDTVSPYPRAGRLHAGVDLYSGPEGKNSAFAVHGGVLKTHAGSGYGYRAYLLLGGVGDPCFHYAHLREGAKAKDWVMAGEKIGITGLTKDVKGTTATNFKDEPYHLHLEFIKSATSSTTPVGGVKSDFKEVVNITPTANASYRTPTGANAFLFQGNRLPLLLPCKSVYCNHSENGKDSGYLNGCKVGNGTNTAYKTCYAIQRFPYQSNLLLSNITDMVSTDLYPNTGLIRYICPHILGLEANKKAQLQAKLKYIHVNKNRFPASVFEHNNETVFNSFFTVNIANFTIDGDTGLTTKTAIQNIIRAYYYCKKNDQEEKDRIISDSDTRIDTTKITAFINKYVNGTSLPTEDAYKIINDFDNWFNSFDFNGMSWNLPS